MNELNPLHQGLIDLGMEDLIPLWEAATSHEAKDALAHIGGADFTARVSSALIDLLRLGRIEVWQGHWDLEPEPVPSAGADALLADHRYYDAGEEELHGLDRVYYVNVENLRHGR
jgi:hypothetical protein